MQKNPPILTKTNMLLFEGVKFILGFYMNDGTIFLYITFASKNLAIEMAKKCLENKLIACANIIPETTSLYEWKNKIEETKETIAIFKTTKNKEESLSSFIKENHDYDCPCIAVLDVQITNNHFSSWIKNSVR